MYISLSKSNFCLTVQLKRFHKEFFVLTVQSLFFIEVVKFD
jgi:hypothetical protein